MNKKCNKWYRQLRELRGKHAEFLAAYKDALKFIKEKPQTRGTAFGRCRELYNEIRPLLLALREDCTRLTKEQKAELEGLKTRFEALPQLHEGIQWVDVEKALIAAPEIIDKLRAFDEKGHAMNVFGEENGEFVFVSAWTDYEQMNEDHRNICFDSEGQKRAESEVYEPTGNAVSIIAAIMGVTEDEARDYLADPKFHEKLRKAFGVNGWAWLKTDAATRNFGIALSGYHDGIYKSNAYACSGFGSFRASLRVKRA